jgi:four helix bundle protein
VLLNHLDIALGSQAEVEVQLEIAMRLEFISRQEYQRLQPIIHEIGRMLNGLIRSLQPAEGTSD